MRGISAICEQHRVFLAIIVKFKKYTACKCINQCSSPLLYLYSRASLIPTSDRLHIVGCQRLGLESNLVALSNGKSISRQWTVNIT